MGKTEEMHKILGAIFHDIYEGVKEGWLVVADITADVLSASREYTVKEHLSAVDALHLVTALYYRCTEFMAADKKLLKVAEKKGLITINPE